MGWNNPAIPWKDLERRLSGKGGRDEAPVSRKRRLTASEVAPPAEPGTPYAELHCHSSFSFLDGASGPAELVVEAIRLGLHGLAITDHDGFYGAPLFAEAARLHPQAPRTVYGAELSLGLTGPQLGVADPEGSHLLVLARGVAGYHRLAAAITEAQLRGDEKGRPVYDLDELAERSGGPGDSDWLVLTGCRKGAVRQALAQGTTPGTTAGPRAAAEALAGLVDRFGRDNVAVELIDHGLPLDSRHNDLLARLAADAGLPTVATNNVHYATPERHRLADAMAAVRARRSLSEMAGWLPAGAAHLCTGDEMAARFARYPGAVARSVTLADECAFDLRTAKPELPSRGIPAGHDAASWLRHLVEEGFAERYAAAYADDPAFVARARERVDHELEVVIRKNFPGYFAIVHDIVAFARSKGILCQGRGSAAASAICYALGITAIDPVFYRLPFERFISEHREEEPDIDVDFDSDRREEVIQWVYETYGRHNAAQVANVIGYRPKMAIRDAAKALGHSPGQQDAWSKQVSSWTSVEAPEDAGIPESVLALAQQFHGAPRHLGIHSGGMILTERPIGEVCPIERGRMDRRTVLQWDKDSCEFMGLVKFDLLGLGMLAALDHLMRIVDEHLGERWELATIPKEEPAVYDMLCRADSIGVFQVESRAQIGTLPRLQPRSFYDLAIEIALIRPGPIQGGAVHPYVRRATGRDPVEFAHPLLIPVLERTKGVPLFQEQLMEMGRVLGDFSADDADLLRRAMGSKRGVERIESLKVQLLDGMREKGMSDEVAHATYVQILSFASFGFAESHALSFAKLVYASSWFKLHYPGAFLAGLLRAQPMGFYSPQSLVQDARRHGVEVRRPDLLRSGATADLEGLGGLDTPSPSGSGYSTSEAGRWSTSEAAGRWSTSEAGRWSTSEAGRWSTSEAGRWSTSEAAGRWSTSEAGRWSSASASERIETTDTRDDCLRDHPEPTRWVPGTPDPTPDHRRDGAFAVRLGLDSVRGISTETAERIVAARQERPFTDLADLSRRAGLTSEQLEALATAGAAQDIAQGLSRREALWSAGWTESADQLPGTAPVVEAPTLPELDEVELTLADLWATGMTPDGHPFAHLRSQLSGSGVLSIADLAGVESGRRVTVAGLVTHRQRPGTAGGVTFLNLEDETGMLNVICTEGLWRRHRKIAVSSSAMLIRGILERSDGVTNLAADRLAPLGDVAPSAEQALQSRHRSRDFR